MLAMTVKCKLGFRMTLNRMVIFCGTVIVLEFICCQMRAKEVYAEPQPEVGR